MNAYGARTVGGRISGPVRQFRSAAAEHFPVASEEDSASVDRRV
jgi:hypothetical protein